MHTFDDGSSRSLPWSSPSRQRGNEFSDTYAGRIRPASAYAQEVYGSKQKKLVIRASRPQSAHPAARAPMCQSLQTDNDAADNNATRSMSVGAGTDTIVETDEDGVAKKDEEGEAGEHMESVQKDNKAGVGGDPKQQGSQQVEGGNETSVDDPLLLEELASSENATFQTENSRTHSPNGTIRSWTAAYPGMWLFLRIHMHTCLWVGWWLCRLHILVCVAVVSSHQMFTISDLILISLFHRSRQQSPALGARLKFSKSHLW